MDGDLRDAIASTSQSRNRLENRRGENDKVPRKMWEAVEISARKVRVGKAKGRRSKRRGWKEKEKKKKTNKGQKTEVKRVAEEWEIWEEEEEAVKSETEAKKLVPERFHKWIKVFGKKQLERMLTRKMWDHVIEMKKGFVPQKGKIYPLSREEVREFVKE